MRTITRLLLVLFCIAFVASVASAKTIDVTGCGSNDQKLINAAISTAKAGDIVSLHGTCVISAPITMKSGVVLKGDGYTKTTIKANKPSSFYSTGMIILSGVSNTELCGFTLHGGETSIASQHSNAGHSTNPCGIIVNKGSSKDKIHDIYFTMLDGDGIKSGTTVTSYIDVYNCQFNLAGHDGIQNWYGNYWHIYHCYFSVYINSGIRCANTIGNTIDHCTLVDPMESGWCGIEVEGNTKELLISECVIKNIHTTAKSCGIATVSASGDMTIKNCVFFDCPGGNIKTSGIKVTQSNIITSNTVPSGIGY